MPARKNGKSKTPQPTRAGRTPQLPAQKKTPKSAPPPKRTMKLLEDEDEKLLTAAQKTRGALLHQKKTPKKIPIKQMQFDEEDDNNMSDEEDMDDFDEDVDDDNSEEDDDIEEDKDAGLPPPQAGQKRKLMETLKQPAKAIPAKQTSARMQQQAKKWSSAATPSKVAATPTHKFASKAAASPTPKSLSKAIQEGKKANETPKLASTPAPTAGKALAEREIRTLFIKNLPMNVTEMDIKALSPDILSIRIRVALRKKIKSKAFAFLEFASEKVAEKNFAQLKDKKVKDNKIYVDFCGEKSSYKKSKKSKPFTGEMDPLRLYISGFPLDTKVEELQRLMPKAVQLDLPKRKRVFGFAFAKFAEAKDAAAALQKHNGTLFKEQVLIVDQARKRLEPTPQAGDKRKAPETKADKGPRAKKAKGPAEEDDEEDEDDDDEDDDDEDEEEEDDEDEEDDEEEEDDEDEEDDDDEDEEDDNDEDEEEDDSEDGVED